MIRIKNEEQIRLMEASGKVVGAILHDLAEVVRPGVTTLEIDRFVEKRIHEEGMVPTFKGYGGFPANACVSVNEELVHGIPSEERVLEEGDIVSVDIGATHKGWVSDAARTYFVGSVDPEKARLVDICRQSFFEALAQCRAGNRLSDIGHAVQECVEGAGFSVVLDYVGHGVGSKMHESPQVKNYGEAGKGPKLMRGMALAIEPMINAGTADVHTLDDGWTVVTDDGKPAAHYENTVIITDSEPLVITLDERDVG
ncbi:MAG: type I methionyl aminopeptidase [Clostridiales Family XIII bacterium]|jgi:methionyl aminopeptidase|nr:type I methionyl aminopeptidase [Clostridiales Family XIII bacterium]